MYGPAADCSLSIPLLGTILEKRWYLVDAERERDHVHTKKRGLRGTIKDLLLAEVYDQASSMMCLQDPSHSILVLCLTLCVAWNCLRARGAAEGRRRRGAWVGVGGNSEMKKRTQFGVSLTMHDTFNQVHRRLKLADSNTTKSLKHKDGTILKATRKEETRTFARNPQ